MRPFSRRHLLASLTGAAAVAAYPASLLARTPVAPEPDPQSFSSGELVRSGHQFFGGVSRGLALTLEEAVRRWGEPNGYILGQEASGAFFGGLRYGEGLLYSRRTGRGGPAGRSARRDGGQRVFWQGPSLGFDVGGEGARSMMLVYNFAGMPDLMKRFIEVEGTAYFIAGFGLTAARADDTIIVPIRSGVGLRLGVNLGYIKFSDAPTWNPF